MFKRCISLILVLVTLVSFLPVPSRAAEVTSDSTQVDFEATNDFGALLTNSLDGSDQAQTSSDANRICDLQFEGDYAWVEFVTTEKANLVVAIYTEDGTQMLGSGTETVSPEETEVGIQIDIENMPQYYSAGAYLLSAEDNTPLSQEFRTQLYTKAVQDIKNSTVDDYDPERVLNLDDDRTTNFAVFGENTILLDSDVVVTVSGNTYTIENASDELKAMQPGDSFAQMQDEEMLIVKAAKVKVSGNTVTVTDDPNADLSDVFEVVKIEGQSTEDNTTWDDSTLDSELEIATEEELYAMTGECCDQRDGQDSGMVTIPIKAKKNDYYSLGMYLIPKVDVTFYFRSTYQYISWSISVSVTGKFELKKEPPKDEQFHLALGYIDIYLGCGCSIHLDPFAFFEPSGKLTTKINLDLVYKKTYDSDLNVWEGSPSIDLKGGLEAEGKLYFGVGFEIGIHFITKKLATLDVTLQIGPELSAKKALIDYSAKDPSQVHTCKLCLEGTVKDKYSMALKFTLFDKDIVSLDSLPGSQITRKRSDFYLCIDKGEFGRGVCPYISYKVKLKVQDSTGAPIPGVSVKIFDASGNAISEAIQVEGDEPFTEAIPNSDDDGVVRIYLTNGRYTAECTTPEETKTVSFTVYKTAKNIPVVLTSATAAPYLSLGEKSAIAYIGVEQQLKATFGSQDVSKAATWTSSDTDVIKVELGTLTPVSVGTATISVAYQADGNKYRTSIPVQVLPRFGFTLSESQVSFATTKTYQLSAFFRDGDQDTAVNSSCIWTSSDPGVVTVDNGLLTPVSAGTATVTAVYYNGDEEMQATCEVEITEVKIVDEGQCGDNVYWKLDEEGTLTLYGSGTTYNYTYSDSPWYYSQPNKLIVEDGVTSIGDRLFNKCKQLSSISIPDSVTIIGSSAFSYCTSLTSVVIPDSVISLGSHAFWHCEALRSVVIGSGITSMATYAFCNCTSLSDVIIKDGAALIGTYAFYYCSSLKKIVIPDSVRTIGASAFNCSAISDVDLGNGVTTIGNAAFNGCTGITSIRIPVSVTSIEYIAFFGCKNLKDIYYDGTTAQWDMISIGGENYPLYSATIHCSDGIAGVGDVPTVIDDAEPIPEETEPVTEPAMAETEPVEETTESTVDTELLSDRNWRILPGGVEMRTGAVTNLAAFTGKESVKNGTRTVSFTGLEPGEAYVLIVSLAPGSLKSADLQYITQATASDSGTLTLSYIPRTDVTAIVQLYGIPTDRGITLDREYVTMKVGASSELLAATVTPAQWASSLVWSSSDETVLAVGTDGSLTPVAPGTAYAIATVTHGKYTLSARCRVDVTEEVANVAVTGVDLGADSVTTQLYSRSYTNFDVLLLLDQNLPQVTTFSTQPQDNGVAITGAKFADDTVRSLFDLQVKDDRTLAVIPTQAAIDAGKTVRSSYKSQVIVSVNGVEFRTADSLTLNVKKDTPKLTAKALTFNSFYSGQTQAISVTGGTVTAITGTTPDWLKLENNKLSLVGSPTKGSATLTLSVATEEWAIPATVKVKASVSCKTPTLKLSKTSVTFANSGSTGISLTLKAGKQSPADVGVKDITACNGFVVENLDLETGNFTLRPTGNTVPTGKQTLTVSFYGTTATTELTLKTAAKVPTLKLSKSSVSVNAVTGDCATLKVSTNPADADLSHVTVTDPNGVFVVSKVDAQGNFTVATTDKTLPGKSYTLEVSAPGCKTIKLKVTALSAKAVPSMTIAASGKIDLTYPEKGLTIVPKLKNYSGELVSSAYALAVKSGNSWVEQDFSRYFTIGSDGKLYPAAGASLASGMTCRITLVGTLPDETTLSASTQVKVTQSAIALKLSKSSLTLNKALEEWATVTVTTTAKGYTLGTPSYTLVDSKGEPSDALALTWENGKLKIAVTQDTVYGATYKLRIWKTSNKVSTLTVRILAQNQSTVSVTAKAKGSLDVIRDSTAIAITPSYKNWAGETPLDRQVKITQALDKKNYTQDVTANFTWQWLENGQLKLQKQPGAQLDPAGSYRLELSANGGKPATVKLSLKSGTAKVTCQAVTLYKKDVNAQTQLEFQVSDTTVNSLQRVRIKNVSQQAMFQVVPWADGQFALATVSGGQAKSCKVTLELFFQGNDTEKPNATVTVPVTVR